MSTITDTGSDPSAAAGGPVPAPSADEIREELSRICAHPVFLRCKTLQRFLRFTVAETLAGRCEHLKEYSIALSALRRGADFDPRNSSIVRSQARNLRNKLEEYYSETGSEIRIDYSAGSYVPTFARVSGGSCIRVSANPARDHQLELIRKHLVSGSPRRIEDAILQLNVLASDNHEDAEALAHISLCLSMRQLLAFRPDLGLQAKSKGLAMRALAIDPACAAASAAMGLVKFLFDWEFDAARDYFAKAASDGPADGLTTVAQALLHLHASQFSAAEELLDRAGREEPENALVHCARAWEAYCAGRSDDALQSLAAAGALQPDCAPVAALRPLVLVIAGRMEEAAEAARVWSRYDWFHAWLGARSGQRAEAARLLRRPEIGPDAEPVPAMFRACILAELGEQELAGALLFRYVRKHMPHVLFIQQDPLYRWHQGQTPGTAG